MNNTNRNINKIKTAKKGWKFTDEIRKDLCGDTYWVGPDECPIHLSSDLDFNLEDARYQPRLKEVVEALVKEAFCRGVEVGKIRVRNEIRAALGIQGK
jgi:hypothetical protein